MDTWASTVSSVASTGLTGGLGLMNLRDGDKVGLNGGFFDTKGIGNFNGFVGSLAGSAVTYGMTGNVTFNVARAKGVGLFEMSFGKDGFSSRFGMGGTDMSFGTIAAAMRGAEEAMKVASWKYGGKESRANLNVVNQSSYIGDEFHMGLASDIWEGRLNVDYKEMDDAYGYYKRGGNTITISDSLLGGGQEGTAKLASVIAHEGTHAYGNDIEKLAHQQAGSTYGTLNAMFGLKADKNFEGQILAGIANPENANRNTGDTDYWTLMGNGEIVYDGSGWLRNDKDEYVDKKGNVVDEKDRIGANVIEVGLLNIQNGGTSGKSYSEFTDEQILLAQGLMGNLQKLQDTTSKGLYGRIPDWAITRSVTDDEKDLMRRTVGTNYRGQEFKFDGIQITERLPTVQEARDAVFFYAGIDTRVKGNPFEMDNTVKAAIGSVALSLPGELIFIDPNARTDSNPSIQQAKYDALVIHELDHQYLYQIAAKADSLANLGNQYNLQAVFNNFITEKTIGSDPYDYNLQSGKFTPDIKSLGMIGTKEGQAHYIEDYIYQQQREDIGFTSTAYEFKVFYGARHERQHQSIRGYLESQRRESGTDIFEFFLNSQRRQL